MVESVVGSPHVGEAGVTAVVGDDLRGEDGALGLHRHVGAVVVPPLVGAQRLGQVVVSRPERAIALDVGECGRCELEFAEATGELILLLLGQVLAREHEQRVLQPQLSELGDGCIARAGEAHIADHRPERRVQWLDADRPHDFCHLAMVRVREMRHVGEIDPSFVISHRLPLHDAPNGYEMFKHKDDDCTKVVLTPDGHHVTSGL